MRTVQQGDRVQVHFVKRTQRGDVDSSRGRTPACIGDCEQLHKMLVHGTRGRLNDEHLAAAY